MSVVPDRLIIFTRYPEDGKAKTRLIPALGAAGATALHRQLAERTVQRARALQAQRSLDLAVQFVGGSVAQMQDWLGPDLTYQAQAAGDLGDRLTAAFRQAFAAGCQRVVAIGTDCPELTTSLLAEAFDYLAQVDVDVVLGPATDGGYYLIGLRRLMPELFQHIAWSTAQVRQQTLAIAATLNLTVAELAKLSDIDRPTDLVLWERLQRREAPPS